MRCSLLHSRSEIVSEQNATNVIIAFAACKHLPLTAVLHQTRRSGINDWRGPIVPDQALMSTLLLELKVSVTWMSILMVSVSSLLLGSLVLALFCACEGSDVPEMPPPP